MAGEQASCTIGAGGGRYGEMARRRGPCVEHRWSDRPLVDRTSRIHHARRASKTCPLQESGEDRRRHRVATVDTWVRSAVDRDGAGAVRP